MPDSVAVVVPWRDEPGRRRQWDWVQGMYRQHHPGWSVIEAGAPQGPWRKGVAVNTAADTITADIVVVADADVWTTGLHKAVTAVSDGAGWAIPHRLVHRLSQTGTNRLIATGECDLTDLDEPPYQGVEGGGIVVLRADTLRDIPIDERFEGWGQEDMSWAIALHYLTGRATRFTADLLHLWHPPQPRDNRKIGSLRSHALWRAYTKARHDPDQMRALLKDGRCSQTF